MWGAGYNGVRMATKVALSGKTLTGARPRYRPEIGGWPRPLTHGAPQNQGLARLPSGHGGPGGRWKGAVGGAA